MEAFEFNSNEFEIGSGCLEGVENVEMLVRLQYVHKDLLARF